MQGPMRLLAGLGVVALLGVACGGEEEVGTGVGLTGEGGDGGVALVDPSRTTTTLAPEIDDQLGTTTTVAAQSTGATTPAQQATTTTAPENLILIQDDEQGHFFEPLLYQVPVGQVVTWRNVGTKPRQLVSDGAFASPEIAPGAEWTFTFTAKGVFDYRDTTRPYATSGRIQVY